MLTLPPDATRAVHAITFDEVMRAWASARDPARGSGPWTRRMLETASSQFAGQWHDVEVRADALLHVMLPRHAGEPCHGDHRELVPAGGLPVGEASVRLRTWDEAARGESAECWRRLGAAMTEPFSRLVLTTAPLDGHPDYSTLPTGPGLFHLDGFHRLLGWALAGRLTDQAWIAVHLAGPVRK